MSTSQVSVTLATSNIIENDVRVGNINSENAGEIHNPTIANEAKELEKATGSGSLRTVFATFWCETIAERNAEFERVVSIWPTSKYILFGAHETTEENKKPHCHCIFAFASCKKWSTIIKSLSTKKYHLEKCRYFNESREYAMKANPKDVLEYGKPLHQGVKNSIRSVLQEAKYNPKKVKEIDEGLYCRYKNGINDICKDHLDDMSTLERVGLIEDEDGNFHDKPYEPTKVLWLYGHTGAGKTRRVNELLREEIKSRRVTKDKISFVDEIENGFFIGSIRDETEILVLDEFRGSTIKFKNLLKLIDGCMVNVKGGQKWIKAKNIYITSCFTPIDCYPNLANGDSIKQLLRRITVEEVRNDECYAHDEPQLE